MELGAGEIVVILAIVMLLFGPSKLPKLGQGLGSAMANFRKGLRGEGEPSAPPAAERGSDAAAQDAPAASAPPDAAADSKSSA